MMSDIMDLDSQQKIRYVSESSNASTSGYSTMSPGGVTLSGGGISPSSSSVFSSPAASPATMIQVELSHLNLPPNSPQYQQQHQSPHYAQLQNATSIPMLYANNQSYANSHGNAMVTLPQQHFSSLQPAMPTPLAHIKKEYPAELRILEHPVEKFRFRYKSEMHGTHGSLNGANSKRTPKTFPEVELRNFHGRAVIRCSLFQTNLESPHSHQLVVRKDDTDICDPHELQVSPEQGYVAQFQNMGIIHTAKKFIFNELLKKKLDRRRFELGRDELSTKQNQELHKETEKEAKDMNLNQVRLCFEAFKVENNNTWTQIAAPVYTNPINNRKSAQTGELRICRLSIATGSVSGGDDLILLVEKVSKKNIKVRFYELSEDEEIVWEAFGRFRESDVHHQYAIVCQTPPYKDKDIENPVEVCIELVRPSDDERSYPPVTFRYKPRDIVVSRKRRRTCSSANSSSSSSSSLSSVELPKTVQEQTANLAIGISNPGAQPMPFYAGVFGDMNAQTISQEFNKDDVLSDMIGNICQVNSEELRKMCPTNSFDLGETSELLGPDGRLETDGASTTIALSAGEVHNRNVALVKIFQIHDEARTAKNATIGSAVWENAARQVAKIFMEHADKSAYGDSIIHEIIASDSSRVGIKMCSILNYFRLNDLLNRALNAQNQSGLHCACLHNRVHYIRPLLGLGCNASIQDRNGNTALHIAVREQHQKCVESFLNMEGLRLNLSLKNDEGLTPLHLAVRHNNRDMVEKLLKHDKTAAFVSNTRDGNNALHMAVVQQNLALMKVILNGQIVEDMLTARNAAGHTVVHLAKEAMRSSTGDARRNEVSEFLTSLSKEATTELQIKEEEMSLSSAEDDEESNESTVESLEMIKIKEENEEPISTGNTQTLKHILDDAQKCQQLAKLLNAPEKWKLLAQKLKIQHLCCLWANAEDLLQHIKNNADNIDYKTFSAALHEVEPKVTSVCNL